MAQKATGQETRLEKMPRTFTGCRSPRVQIVCEGEKDATDHPCSLNSDTRQETPNINQSAEDAQNHYTGVCVDDQGGWTRVHFPEKKS